jgi:hypothetical protein
MSELGHRLGFTREPRTELSVRAWDDERRVKDDFYRAAPAIPTHLLVPYMVRDAFDEHLTTACSPWRLIVVRDLPTELPHPVQMLIHIVDFRSRERGFHSFASFPGPRFALVLEGWAEPTARVRLRETKHFTVRQLPVAPIP